MTIKRSMRLAFFSLCVLVSTLFLLSARTAHINRNTTLLSKSFHLIERNVQAGLSMLHTDDSALTERQINTYLSKSLADSDFQYRIITSDDSFFDGKEPLISEQLRTSIAGKKRDCYYFRVSDTDYYVCLWAVDVENFVPMGTSYWIQIALTAILIIVAGVLLSEFTTQYISKPISSLLTAIREAATGNLDVQCDIHSSAEMTELGRNFNRMLHIISSNYEDLSSMHDELQANEEELRKNYDHIEFLAYHDVLTQLPNKIAFYDKVYGMLNSRIASKQMHAIFFVDLDNFKTINDTLGHDYGDELLAQTATTLNNLMRPQDILSRAGGDEFLIFRANISSVEEAVSFGESILELFQQPFNLNGEIAYVSMSIGLSVYPINGLSHTVLIKNADIAMYHSKDIGKNRLTVFTSQMEEQIQREANVLEVLRHAIENKEIYLVYQPQFSQKTGEITGYEALMRINSAKLGPLSPTEFIPIAENNGLIFEFGVWALREACSMNKNLIDRGFRPRTVAVNLSSLQLNRVSFQNTVESILQETGLPPEYLELELTESMLVSSVTNAAQQLHALKSLGLRIALDDFGTGYSSLNYLANLPISTLKIDKSFIDNISQNERDSQMAKGIISLAHSLHIKVVAEGVETHEQLSLLDSQNCDLIQGYLLSRPLLPEELAMLLD